VAEKADVVVVGGGPAGLNCALILARCRRRVILFDDGRQRNRFSEALHGFVSRDDVPPGDLLRRGRADCKKYGVRFVQERVLRVRNKTGGFAVTTESGVRYECSKLVLATGLTDTLPPFPRAEEFFGRSMFHCPFCDGYEFTHLPWGVYASGAAAAVENCLRYLTWTSDITLIAHNLKLSRSAGALLERNGITVITEPVTRLDGRQGMLRSIVFSGGKTIPLRALFFSIPAKQQSDLGDQLGCKRNSKGVIVLNKLQQSSVNGLYVVGDMAREMQLAVIAAAEGAKAAVAIEVALNKEERV
jgi:thioredoxin reductase